MDDNFALAYTGHKRQLTELESVVPSHHDKFMVWQAKELSNVKLGTFYFKILILIALPIFSFLYLKKKEKELEELEFRKRFGSLY